MLLNFHEKPVLFDSLKQVLGLEAYLEPCQHLRQKVLQKCLMAKRVNYFRKKPHLRCLTGL